MDALRQTPDWLETGLGGPLFLATYLVSVLAGSATFVLLGTPDSVSVGASGGICGLYGLLFVCLARMGSRQTSLRILCGMALLFLFGAFSDDISNAGHVGGFLGGLLVGVLYGPQYRPSYSLRRKTASPTTTLPGTTGRLWDTASSRPRGGCCLCGRSGQP